MTALAEHWNRIYRETADHRLGWHEEDPSPTVDLLDQVPGWQQSTLFIPGAGTSVLIDVLLDAGAHLILNDLSTAALERIRMRLSGRGRALECLCGTIASALGDAVPMVDVWIDRAVLHFLTVEADIRGYFDNLRAKLRSGGHALFAEFPPHGEPKCAGLALHRYSLEELSERLGPDFGLVDHFNHTYINPAGEPRPYIYALFRRMAWQGDPLFRFALPALNKGQ